MAITPDVSPMEAGSTVAVASKTIGVGVGVNAVLDVFLEANTILLWLVLIKNKLRKNIRKTKNFVDRFIAGLSIT